MLCQVYIVVLRLHPAQITVWCTIVLLLVARGSAWGHVFTVHCTMAEITLNISGFSL